MSKTIRSAMTVLLVLCLVFSFFIHTKAAGAAGYWELKGTWHTEIVPVDPLYTANTWEAKAADGSVTGKFTAIDNTVVGAEKIYVYTYAYTFNVSGTNNSVKEKLYPGDEVMIDMTLNYQGIDPAIRSNSARIYAGAFNNYPADNLLMFSNPGGAGSKTIKIPVPSGNSSGQEQYVTVHCEGGYQPIEFSYIYIWVDESSLSLTSASAASDQPSVDNSASYTSPGGEGETGSLPPVSIDENEPIRYDSLPAQFNSLTGTVEICSDPDSEDWEPVGLNTKIKPGDHIATRKNSSCIIQFPDKNTYVVGPETEIVFNGSPEQETKLGLVLGRIWANTKKILTEGQMINETSQAVAGIKGTTYILEDDGVFSTLKVIEGKVEYKSKATGEVVYVEGGQTATATESGMGKVQSFNAEAENAWWAPYLSPAEPDRDTGLPLALLLIVGTFITAIAVMIAVLAVRKKRKAVHPAERTMNAQVCGLCGIPLPPNSTFCPKCGSSTK